jgi:hypothetical protein
MRNQCSLHCSFSQTIPPRFKKEMVTAADKNKDGMISVAEIEALLDNIGASEKLTRAEVGKSVIHALFLFDLNWLCID